MTYDLITRTNYLSQTLKTGTNCLLQDSSVSLKFCSFNQKFQTGTLRHKQHRFVITPFCSKTDDNIIENSTFQYPMFIPQNAQNKQCILLLHGLNERNWDKYGCWAEQLAYLTGKPIILFPIAFHMNRTPKEWYNPRVLIPFVKERMKSYANPQNLTFANLVLSERLSTTPLRFYASGRETADNIWQLASEIKAGKHPYLEADTHIDIFAYSIGALLAQIMVTSNPEELFSDSKLFCFCGGSVFNQMNGNSRYIMDADAFSKIKEFYTKCFLHQQPNKTDLFEKAFKEMIHASYYKAEREKFYQKAINRCKFISLRGDTVIPTCGIKSAIGNKAAQACLTELDFNFKYSHETPFSNDKKEAVEVNRAFKDFIEIAANYLC